MLRDAPESSHTPTQWLSALVDHEVSSVGISAGHIDGLSLESCRAVLEALGCPDDALKIIHITGTNGKGTVARMCEALIAASGLRVGCYLSPEGTLAERIRIDGEPIRSEDLDDAIHCVRSAAEAIDHRITAFEAMTLAAIAAFADAPVDVAVIEVGLLGRFDATNVVDGDVAVITNVGADHTDFSSNWKHKIASEKAGIIKSDSIAVIGDVDDEVYEVIASEQCETMLRSGRDFRVDSEVAAIGGRFAQLETHSGATYDVMIPMFGAHQAINAALALQAVESLLGVAVSSDLVGQAFGSLRVPGRVELLAHEPLIIVDGAHNRDAASALGKTLSDSFMVVGSRIAVIGVMKGRDPVAFISALHQQFALDALIAVPIDGPRGEPAEVVERAGEQLDLPVLVAPSVERGLERAVQSADAHDVVIVTGSFRLVEPARLSVQRLMNA